MSRPIRISSTEKLELISNLATMISAGIPILETVESILEDSKGNQKKFLEQLRADLVQGNHISIALKKFPYIFDNVTVSLMMAAEEAGTLDVTLHDLKANIKRDAEFHDKIKAALTYPILIMIVFTAVLVMILVVVIPKISSVFLRLKVELPLPTKILIFLSDLLIHNTLITLAVIGVFIGIFVYLYREKRKELFRAFFSLPLISSLIKKIDLARFTRSMYLLLNAGIPISSALDLAAGVVSTKGMYEAIKHSQEMVLSGKRLSDGFKDERKYFPSIMIKITEAGEKSGSLDKSMQEVSDFLDYEVEGQLQTTTSLLEPLMLVVVGLLVGGMMLAIIAPIYGLVSQVGSR